MHRRRCATSTARLKRAPREKVRVRVMRSFAHPQGVFVYGIEMDDRKLVFATDVEGYAGGDRQLIQLHGLPASTVFPPPRPSRFAREAGLLIHDAEFTSEKYVDGNSPRQGRGHST